MILSLSHWDIYNTRSVIGYNQFSAVRSSQSTGSAPLAEVGLVRSSRYVYMDILFILSAALTTTYLFSTERQDMSITVTRIA